MKNESVKVTSEVKECSKRKAQKWTSEKFVQKRPTCLQELLRTSFERNLKMLQFINSYIVKLRLIPQTANDSKTMTLRKIPCKAFYSLDVLPTSQLHGQKLEYHLTNSNIDWLI